MRVDPDDAARSARLRHADERAQRDGVVAAEHERQRAALDRLGDDPRQTVAEIEDLAEVTGVLVADHRRLGDRGDDVPHVRDLHAELLRKLVLEPRVANRGRAHVDAAPPRAEVERPSDHGHLAGCLVHIHRGEANARGRGGRATLTPAQPRRGSSAGRALG